MPSPAPNSLRLFLAFPLPDALKARLGEVQQGLDTRDLDLAWTPPEAMHLTVHFLGATPPNVLADLKHDLGACFHRFRPFDLYASGLGCFPDPLNPRVLWAGVQDPHGLLAKLHGESRHILNRYRLFKLDEHAYVPHLSLGRVREVAEPYDPRAFTRALKAWGDLGPLPCEQGVLYQSRLSHAGARHEALQEYPLDRS